MAVIVVVIIDDLGLLTGCPGLFGPAAIAASGPGRRRRRRGDSFLVDVVLLLLLLLHETIEAETAAAGLLFDIDHGCPALFDGDLGNGRRMSGGDFFFLFLLLEIELLHHDFFGGGGE